MTEPTLPSAQDIEAHAAAVGQALQLLMQLGDVLPAVRLIEQELSAAFTAGWYAGIEAWDLAHNSAPLPPHDGESE